LGSTRGETKQETAVGLLDQPKGTTIAAIMKATGWQPERLQRFGSDACGAAAKSTKCAVMVSKLDRLPKRVLD
jgi:hypothetical protein